LPALLRTLCSEHRVTLLAPGTKLVHFDAIDSTNAEAQRQALKGERGPTWLVADRQTLGRGRHGRHWVSESGNLFATLLLTLSIDPAIAAQLSFVAALAALETARLHVADGAKLSVKWPNDILIEGKKAAGILAETAAISATGELAIAIGCGLNVSHVPNETPYPVTCLAHHGCTASRDDVFAALAVAMSEQLAAWSTGEGFDIIRQCWLAQAAGLGGRASVEGGQGRIAGTFVNLAADGALILRLDNGEQRAIYGGEVTFEEIEKSRRLGK
jgi:BirA family biotin operon repressor/biotin-[acetyl-CoA-carboxylase] ligase